MLVNRRAKVARLVQPTDPIYSAPLMKDLEFQESQAL